MQSGTNALESYPTLGFHWKGRGLRLTENRLAKPVGVPGLLCSGIYWRPSVRWPSRRSPIGVPTGATLSNHLIDQGNAQSSGYYETPAGRMPAWARTLLGLFVVVLLCVAY